METMDKKIENMSNHELGEVAKAFANCASYNYCNGCPCDGVLCNHKDVAEARDYFICVVAERFY